MLQSHLFDEALCLAACEKKPRKFQGVFDSCKFCSSRQDFDVSQF